MPPFLKKNAGTNGAETPLEETNLNVEEGKNLDLVCGAFGKPEPEVKWYSFKHRESNNLFLKCNFSIKNCLNLS